MYVLYHFPYSQHARRVVALLEAAGLSYELRNVAMEKGEHMSPEFLAVNPNHQVPVLIDGSFKLFESSTILRYLCEKHTLANWYPVDSRIRATVDQWLDWNQCRLTPAVMDIVLNTVFLGNTGDKAAITRGRRTMVELAAILDTALKGRTFLAGSEPTIADLSVGSNIFQLSFVNAVPGEPNVRDWYQRVNAIDGFQKSLPTVAISDFLGKF